MSKIEFKEINFGLFETQNIHIEKMLDSPSGNLVLSNSHRLLKKTDKIPVIIGQKFGIEYKIEAVDSKIITVEKVWIFPKEIIDDKGKVFKEVRYNAKTLTNYETYTDYNLEKNFEVVKGDWTFQMFYNGHKIYEKIFHLE